ncbi:hypothetical protein EJ02DRAFT_489888 [Clathrospora elynae]|uniref:RING-type domain-containing protein n=1 Tax=Clathrospora elynae TaxID=706981 RepID=A0A6A5S8D4_9PLEO|nr:hypothetical protein EJ02DRAFT_489888 [Clathrospora elynae]
MTISKSQGATKKLGPISVGNKVVRFKVGNVKRRFTVHEGTQITSSRTHSNTKTRRTLDLICRTSSFFKDHLQTRRKPISHSDECCVCAEALNTRTKDLAFCLKCGQNIHEVCIEAWKRSSSAHGKHHPPLTCPMCRAPWKNETLLTHLTVEAALDPTAVHAYLDWLYTHTLNIDQALSRKLDAFNVQVLALWAVAAAVQDAAFKSVVISTDFAEARARFWVDSVKWAFVGRRGNDEIRDYVIDIFMAYMEPGWFKKHAEKWPGTFVRELFDVAMMGWGARKSFGELRRE